MGRAVEELGYLWYEDPLAEEDIYHYIKLKVTVQTGARWGLERMDCRAW